jgi:hypothetical protein
VKTVADTLGVARSNLAVQARCERSRRRRGRRPHPEAELVTEIKALIAGQATYGYRRIQALAEAFVITFKRDYARVSAKPDAASVLPARFLVRTLQQRASTQGAGLPLTARVQKAAR